SSVLFAVLLLYAAILFLYCYRRLRGLHSFPTRRSSDLRRARRSPEPQASSPWPRGGRRCACPSASHDGPVPEIKLWRLRVICVTDRKSTRLNSSHGSISYAVFCLKKKKKT